MADKNKLTVAELLARDKKARGEKGGKDDKRSRRHRRSLDEGGISVAELTGNLKKVEASPAEAKHTSVSIDEDAPVIRAPKPAAEKPTADKAGADKATAAKPVAEKPKADKGAKAAGAGAAAAGAGAAAAAAVPASKKAGVAKDAEETGNLPKIEDDEEWIEEEHEKLNPVSILLMIVAGILLAIVIFKGFEILWDSFPRVIVAILALCVTAIMVGVTHALRTARDGFSMFLAGFTGLILTFGSLLLVML